MPVYDYCMPEKECTCGGCEDDPCEIFRHVKFPVNEFFRPTAPRPSRKPAGAEGLLRLNKAGPLNVPGLRSRRKGLSDRLLDFQTLKAFQKSFDQT